MSMVLTFTTSSPLVTYILIRQSYQREEHWLVMCVCVCRAVGGGEGGKPAPAFPPPYSYVCHVEQPAPWLYHPTGTRSLLIVSEV